MSLFLSTLTLAMEILIGVVIFYVIYRGYKENNFPEKLAMFAVAYEIVFNVGYMVYRAVWKPQIFGLTQALKITAALHGILSLIMLIAVVVFFLLARKNYRKDINYFRKYKITTFLFISFWLISLFSGGYLYFKIYF